jgi:pantothenate synthetase
LAQTDYALAVSAEDLRPAVVLQGRILLVAAARFGATRLLDNTCLDVGPDGVSAALP